MNDSDAGKTNNFHEKNFGDQANNNDKQITILHKEDSQRGSLNRTSLNKRRSFNNTRTSKPE